MSAARSEVLPESQVPPSVPARKSHQHLIYCAILLLLPALFLLSSILIVRSASFPKVSADPFLLFSDTPFTAKDQDCDILIFGDSTAATGVDPLTVQERTGLKTCNIAQSQSILAIMGTKPLDTFLRHNRPPQVLVLQFAPETLSIAREDFFWPEGLTVLLRHDFGPRAIYRLARNLHQSYGFALWAIKYRISSLRSVPNLHLTETLYRQHRGLIVLPKPPESRCEMTFSYEPPDASWIRSLRAKYSTAATQVIVNVSPIPTCAANAVQISSSLHRLTDNALPLYPIRLFCDLDRHLNLDGAIRFSQQLAQQILSKTPKTPRHDAVKLQTSRAA